jgi:antitoxin FitA
MSQLIVRNVAPAIVDALKARAVRHRRSAEAEHRELLREALLKRRGRSLKAHLLAMPNVGDDADFQVPRGRGRRVSL